MFAICCEEKIILEKVRSKIRFALTSLNQFLLFFSTFCWFSLTFDSYMSYIESIIIPSSFIFIAYYLKIKIPSKSTTNVMRFSNIVTNHTLTVLFLLNKVTDKTKKKLPQTIKYMPPRRHLIFNAI